MKYRYLLIALTTAIWGCTANTTQLVSNSDDQKAVSEVSEQWVDAFRARDLDALMSLYTNDARIMSQDKARVTGKADIRQMFEQLLGAETLPGINIDIEEVGLMGDFAWASVLAAIVGAGPDAEAPYLSRTFILYRKQADGSWRIFRDMDHSTPDAKRVPLP
ncbi:MAG: SgcJ/EcaC family oxidoreductase [Gammaproteobacteria bacterium]